MKQEHASGKQAWKSSIDIQSGYVSMWCQAVIGVNSSYFTVCWTGNKEGH